MRQADHVRAAQSGDAGPQPHRLGGARRRGSGVYGPARPSRGAPAAHCVAREPQGGSRGSSSGGAGMTITRQIQIAHPSTGDEEWQAVREPLASGWLTQGPKVAEFERTFAERHRVKHAIAVSSCTTGLHLMLAAAGIGPGDEVVVPAFTWVATANVVIYTGATPVLVDVDRITYNIDLADLARR